MVKTRTKLQVRIFSKKTGTLTKPVSARKSITSRKPIKNLVDPLLWRDAQRYFRVAAVRTFGSVEGYDPTKYIMTIDYMSFPVKCEFLEISVLLESCTDDLKGQLDILFTQMRTKGMLSSSDGMPSCVLSMAVYYNNLLRGSFYPKAIPIGPVWGVRSVRHVEASVHCPVLWCKSRATNWEDHWVSRNRTT